MNFCSDVLTPLFTSNKPCADGYELKNLIEVRSKRTLEGFRGEGFTRPPFDIVVEFPVAIDIARIVIGTKLKERCSTGFNLFVTLNDSILKEKVKKSFSDPQTSKEISQGRPPLPKSSSHPNLHYPEYSFSSKQDSLLSVGRWFSNGESYLVLKNLQYKHWLNFPLPQLKTRDHTYEGTLKHPDRNALKSVKSLTLRITRVTPAGPPVLGLLEIWGQPSVSSSPSTRKFLIAKWLKRVEQQRHKHSEHSSSHLYKPLPNVGSNNDPLRTSESASIGTVPDEFLDPLTCEVMVVPLLLPSRNSIDAHSLEKFIANEAIWGRPPSDPFTGVPFKKDFKPIPNSYLKSCIDRFLLTDSSIKGKTPQTVFSIADKGSLEGPSTRKRRSEYQEKEPCSPKKKALLESHLGLCSKDNRTMEDKSPPPESNIAKEDAQHADKSKMSGIPRRVAEPNVGHKDETSQSSVTRQHSSESQPTLNQSKEASDAECSSDNDITKDIQEALKGKPSCIPRRVEPKPSKDNMDGSKVPSSKLENVYMPQIIAKPPPSARGSREGSHNYIHAIGAALHTTQKQPSQVKPLHNTSAYSSTESLPHPPYLTKEQSPQREDFNMDDFYAEFEGTCPCGNKDNLYSLKCAHILCRQCLLNRPPLPFGAVQCPYCITISHRRNISRRHPGSIFSCSQ